MPLDDLYIIVALAVVAVVAVGFAVYFSRGRSRASDMLKGLGAGIGGGISSSVGTGTGDIKKDLKVLKFQRDLVGDAVLRVYEANFISKEDKDYLLDKYKSELKDLDKRIAEYTALVDISELENAKEEIMNLMQVKISQIDKKLEELKKEYGVPSSRKREIVKEDKGEQVAAVEEKPARKKPQEEDRFTKLYDEVNDVLEKLEQIDVS